MKHDVQVRLIRELLDRIDGGTNVDAGSVRALPVTAYTDPELAKRERERFFDRHPQIIGLSGDLDGPNAFLTTDDLGFPLLATRGGDGVFRAFVNACPHRGATVETRDRGTARRHTCPYHAWSFDTSGRLAGLPKPDHFGLDTSADCLDLVQLPSLEVHGLLVVHPQVDGVIDPDRLFDPELAEELDSWALGDLAHLGADRYDADCNWKLAMDTFGEAYHFPTLHKDSLFGLFYGNVQSYDTFGRNHRMVLARREIDRMRDRPVESWDITIAGLPIYWLFPNVQLIPFRQGCYLVRAYPDADVVGRHTTRITFYHRPGRDMGDVSRDLPDNLLAERAASAQEQLVVAELFSAIIQEEDYEMAAAQQRSAASGRVRTSVFGRNEPALQHFHDTYRRELGLPPLDAVETMAEVPVAARAGS